MTDAFNDYRKAWLASAIKGKQDKIAVLTVKTSLEEIRKSLYAIVSAEAPRILEMHKQPILNEDRSVNSEEPWEVIPHFIMVRDEVYADLAIYAARILTITEALWQTKQLKINKKKSTAADILTHRYMLIRRERGSTRDSRVNGQRGKDQTDRNRSRKDREERKPATKRVGQKPQEVVSPSGLEVRTTSQMRKPTNPKLYCDIKVIRLTRSEYRRWSLIRRYLGRDDSE